MTNSPTPGPASGPREFRPVYTPPTWYLQNQASAPAAWPATATSAPPPAAPPVGCKVCGAAPAAPVTIRAHQGFILAMRWHTLEGPFCAICGTALVREMTTKTLWQGWWGVGSLIFGTPYALLSNWAAHRKLRRLVPAVPAYGTHQLQIGKPVLRRPLAYVALVPFCWAIWLIASNVAA
ncbi:hypothetical protein ACF1AO_34355 [Streptomyces longwoodensis]|uniref:hypothetical protein n=1 Tax=Streptomyces longwoodensis TaxID=68231 RepID=UPI0036F954F6